jgi:hypothetical protein
MILLEYALRQVDRGYERWSRRRLAGTVVAWLAISLAAILVMILVYAFVLFPSWDFSMD